MSLPMFRVHADARPAPASGGAPLTMALSTLSLALLLGGCAATVEPGWTGEDAVPFDQARADCDAEVAGIPDRDQYEAAFEACMASRGWTRPPR